MALRQLQVVTQVKSQFEWELLCEQHGQNMREDELIAREINKIQAATAKWKEQLADKQQDQWARVLEQFATTFRKVLSQVSPVDLVRLLTWFFSPTNSSGAVPACSMDDMLTTALQWRTKALADDATPGSESSHAPPSTASPASTNNQACWVCTPPLALPMSNIQASGTPLGFSFLMLVIGTQSKKQDCFADSVSDDQCEKRACIRIKAESLILQPLLQCQHQISSSGHCVWHHSHQRQQRTRTPFQHQG